ncbi:hypothetical protein SAMN05216464_10319 [Mucilaginibacter pineti]|uniref:Uncharacterized protein n=1 Tax=Mucilaginibacter pineti TaxID=1391627 RepID=A0A1G6YLE1_9SPHI|nr:DUF6526 family protein [Mucilaginibacter pineti]SDD91142.1 hypothetical protein SAMN05216464_10319 [Mucilaginibacter pineti]
MDQQNFENHKRNVAGFHYLLSFLLIAGLIGAVVNAVYQFGTGDFFTALLLLLFSATLFLMSWFIRTFPIRAQDRAIRAEEGLRYFILTRQPLSNKLSITQIAALRFAPDDELLPLVEKTLAENMAPTDIKKAIKNWRADHHRV